MDFLMLWQEFMWHKLKPNKKSRTPMSEQEPTELCVSSVHHPGLAPDSSQGNPVFSFVCCISSLLKQIMLIHMHIQSILKLAHAVYSLPGLFFFF